MKEEQREPPFVKQRMHSVNGVKEPHSVLIPSVEMVAGKIAAVPAGQRGDLAGIRQELARENGTDITCPVTTRQHLETIAAQSHAAFQAQADDWVPYWRVVDPGKPATRKLPGGADFVRERLTAESA